MPALDNQTAGSVWDRAALAAAAQGETMIVGVRAHNGSWFAHCDGTEVDGSGPETALESLIDQLAQNAVEERAATAQTADAAARRAEQLAAATNPNRTGEDDLDE